MRSAVLVATAFTAAILVVSPEGRAAEQKSLASSLDVYVFPTAAQSAAQQSQDEAECYGWAVTNTGQDPFELAKQADAIGGDADSGSESSRGSALKGAAGGAAAGALLGEITGDSPGKGAAYGAAAGTLGSRIKSKREERKALEEQAREAEAYELAYMQGKEAFNKGFSVCLEAKQYLVRY